MTYKLIYVTIDEGQFSRASGDNLNELIALAEEEQGQYDDCHIGDQGDRAVWEPSLGLEVGL